MLAEYSSVVSRYGTRRSIGVLLAAASFLFILLSYYSLYLPNADGLHAAVSRNKSNSSTKAPHHDDDVAAVNPAQQLYDAASNRTLGLDSIQFLNLPHRHDRFDSAFIQGYLADIDVELFPAVLSENLKDAGMPPTEKTERLKWGEKGCWRAHANVWQRMLQKRIPAMLILESDAAWDVNLRSIMGSLNKPFRELLVEDNPHHHLALDPEDPWGARTGLWDILTLGHCFDSRRKESSFRIYDDPHASTGTFNFEEHEVRNQRVVFRASGMVCTTGYIISLRGAAKLLVRTAWNLDEPVDLIMNNMANAGELITYNVQQRIVAQWVYVQGVGMGQRGANSDINNGPSEEAEDGWAKAKETMSVWTYKTGYDNTNFEQMALQVAWKKVMEKV